MHERVVILGKTKMGVGVCVGGMIESTGRPVRLFPVGATCHKSNTRFQIGDIWEMELRARPNPEPPHVEDHDERRARLVSSIPDLAAFIMRMARPHVGEPTALFEGRLKFRPTGTAFLGNCGPLPASSVGFWITPREMVFAPYEDRPRYLMPGEPRLRVPYVGFAPTEKVIPAGSLVRLSLARWWANPNAPDVGPTCSLQLSGWFGLSGHPDAVGPAGGTG